MTKNTVVTKTWTAADVTSATIGSAGGVWELFEDAFSGFGNVTFVRDTTNSVLYIYLGENENKKMFITVGVNTPGYGVLIQYHLMDKESNNDEICAYSNSFSNTIFQLLFLKTVYGVAWGFDQGATSVTYPCSKLMNVFTVINTPCMILNADYSVSSAPEYIISPLHLSIEKLTYNTAFLSTSIGGQKLIITNAYSTEVDLKLRHLFKVLASYTSENAAKGSIEAGGKRLFWLGRYALEYV